GPDARLRGRQHLRRRGALARPAALGAAHRDADPAGPGPAARRGARRHGPGAGRRRHLVRRAVRQRQRRKRLLRPVTCGGRPAVRPPGPPAPVHEPVELHLPALPAPAPPGALVADRCCAATASEHRSEGRAWSRAIGAEWTRWTWTRWTGAGPADRAPSGAEH